MLKSLFKKKPRAKNWSQNPVDLPWTDQPDAIEKLDSMLRAGKLDPSTGELVRKWIDDGYCVAKGHTDLSVIDAINQELDNAWTTDKPIENLTFNDVYMKEGEPPVHIVPHRDIVALPPAERMEVRARGKFRVHGYHMQSPMAEKVFRNKKLQELVSLLLGVDTPPLYSISFTWGSRHGIHQDLMVFHVHPANYLIGAWIAMEDIDSECGPVVYYPGSHREAIYREYNNYPQTNLRTSDDALRKRYEADLARIGEKYERHQFTAKKGDVLLWHAMLLHGGDDIVDTSKTRRSFVIHYVPTEFNKAEEVVGPFMW